MGQPDIESQGKSLHDLGYSTLMQSPAQIVSGNPDAASYVTEDLAEFLRSFKIWQLLSGSATGALSGSVYSATTTLNFNKAFSRPPVCLAYVDVEATGVEGDSKSLLQRQTLEFYPGLISGIFDGYICTAWTRMEIFRDHVDIKSYSASSFTERYLVFVLYE